MNEPNERGTQLALTGPPSPDADTPENAGSEDDELAGWDADFASWTAEELAELDLW